MDSLQKLDIKLLEGTSLFGHLLLLKPFRGCNLNCVSKANK